MLKLKEGQTYICKESDIYWWTVGEEYSVTSNAFGRLAIINDAGSFWYENELNMLQPYLTLKEETTNDRPN